MNGVCKVELGVLLSMGRLYSKLPCGMLLLTRYLVLIIDWSLRRHMSSMWDVATNTLPGIDN